MVLYFTWLLNKFLICIYLKVRFTFLEDERSKNEYGPLRPSVFCVSSVSYVMKSTKVWALRNFQGSYVILISENSTIRFVILPLSLIWKTIVWLDYRSLSWHGVLKINVSTCMSWLWRLIRFFLSYGTSSLDLVIPHKRSKLIYEISHLMVSQFQWIQKGRWRGYLLKVWKTQEMRVWIEFYKQFFFQKQEHPTNRLITKR